MYHYIRELALSRYPKIKARNLSEFRAQLDHIGQNFHVVTTEHVIAAIKGESDLPVNAAWLTFDDGYIDHYTMVLPLLHERGWQGSFFPPVRPVKNRELLDVNRIHFILASCTDHQAIVDIIQPFVNERQDAEGVRPFTEYWSELAHPSRMDPADVMFIKNMLQYGLPEALRNELAAALFARFVSSDSVAFASELYMSFDQLRTMVRCGMYVGSHGSGHYWLDRLDTDSQAKDVDASIAFLRDIEAPTTDWVMCYPYGAYNESLIQLLTQRGCVAGLTTRVDVAKLGSDAPMTLPRLDTNDLPIA